ncbi:MAG: porphobilinogen synthase [Tatlockia sp.]|nr:porphobilinogen synthase [Tatlockia sp.]
MIDFHLPLRLRRLRRTPAIRAMLQETRLNLEQFIAPLFISELIQEKQEIKSMPGQYQLSLDCLSAEIEELSTLGIKAVLLFGIPAHKDAIGSSSFSSIGIIQQAIRKIRELNQDMLIICDVCFCEYTDHGHCGALKDKSLDNDSTLELLVKQALSYAEAGADWVAPSGMIDGMVSAIRQGLDKAGFKDTAILSYAVKYSSCFYGPFRHAANGAPQFGDRKTYQMNPANANEALREVALDLDEGADLIMVKPAMNYLDVIFRVKQHFPEIPLCAYQVSGEYSMLKNAATQGLINEEEAMIESLIAIKRAGADIIISYFTKDFAKLLRSKSLIAE